MTPLPPPSVALQRPRPRSSETPALPDQERVVRCSVSSTKSQGLGPVEFPSCLPLIFFKKPFISTIRHFRAGCTVSSAFQTGVAGEIVSFLFSVSSSSPRRVICSRFYLFSSRSSIILSHIVPRRSPDMAASPQPPPLPGPTQRPLCSSLGTQTPDFSGSPHPVSFPPKTVGTRLFLWGGGTPGAEQAWARGWTSPQVVLGLPACSCRPRHTALLQHRPCAFHPCHRRRPP